jgi:Na+/H+ antiporter NhaD/arsenite permease-like protein
VAPEPEQGVVAALGVPVGLFLLTLPGGTSALLHGLEEYVSFIVLLTALYVISGGVVLTGDLPARPATNTLFLAGGEVLANVIGTTGASMLLVHPLLRTNSERKNVWHIPVFFIFVVSNTGGLLTPLGDPPLFLGFLKGVPFFWTARLWPQWLLVNGVLLAVFYAWDRRAYRRESAADITREEVRVHPLRLRGLAINGPLMLAAVGAVLAKKSVPWFPVTELILAALAAASWRATPRSLRHANNFSWGPSGEVAVLFAGIFVTMVPALALVGRFGDRLGVTEPWQFFWLTGLLSAGLDNAPTYVTMGELGVSVTKADGFAGLAADHPRLLAAVSCGAVFMGAMSYIGNGPNFLVEAIAEKDGYRTPSFFGYIGLAAAVLVPVWVLVTVLFFV